MKESIKLKKRLPRIEAIQFDEWTGGYRGIVRFVNSCTPDTVEGIRYEEHNQHIAKASGIDSKVETLLTITLSCGGHLTIRPGQWLVLENDCIKVMDEQDLLMDWEVDE